MAYDDGVKSAPIAYIGLISVLVLIISVLLLQVVFFGETESMLATDQAQQGQPAELADLTAKQLTTLTPKTWSIATAASCGSAFRARWNW